MHDACQAGWCCAPLGPSRTCAQRVAADVPGTNLRHAALLRGDIVRLETYFAEDGRLTTRRDWRLTDATTGRYLGAATR